jgi:hypothetical protein
MSSILTQVSPKIDAGKFAPNQKPSDTDCCAENGSQNFQGDKHESAL